MEDNATYRERLKDLKGIVVIPTFNNEGTVCDVIASVRQYSSDILVVNDGSTDRTEFLLSKIDGIQIISYPRNKGKGYALKMALKHAAERGYRYAITIDADGQHFADDLRTFVDRIEQVPDSLLIGARNLQADNMPSKNTFANKFSNFWYKVETGKKLADTQSGYRLYPLYCLQNMIFITRRYEFEVEIIVRAAWRGVNVENIPVKVYYPPAEERVSHFRPLQDFTRISILNTILVLFAFLCYYPWKFVRNMNKENIHKFIDSQIIHSSDSKTRLSIAMGWGVFCGIIPLWGYQMIFAGITAHLFKLNKIVTLVFSNISIPPMIPFILYGSVVTGAWVLDTTINYSLSSVSIESVTASLVEYVVGSLVMAVCAGLLVAVLSYVLMAIFKKRSFHA